MSVGTYQYRLRGSPSAPWGAWIPSTLDYAEETSNVIRSGKKCPNFRKLQNAGAILPVNEYRRNAIISVRSGGSGLIQWLSGGTDSFVYGQEQFTDYYDPGLVLENDWRLPIPSMDEGLINAAVNDAIAEASASATMLPVSIIEARSTLTMLKNALKRLLNLLSSFVSSQYVARSPSPLYGLSTDLVGCPFTMSSLGLLKPLTAL